MNETNSSDPIPSALANVRHHMSIVSAVLYTVICVAGVVGNGLVIYVTGFKMKKTVNCVWFLNLSLADFLFTAFLIFYIVNITQEHIWHFGAAMCKLLTFVQLLSMFASVFFLLTISLDRCLSIWAAVWAHNKRTVRKAQLIAFLIWTAAMICSIPAATFREVVDLNNYDIYCVYRLDTPHLSLAIFRFVVGFVFPFLVICVCNVAIHVRTRHLQGKRKRKSQRIIFAIIFAFFICWLPVHVARFLELSIVHDLDESERSIFSIANSLFVSLAFMNSCLNPILYVLMCDDFQKKLKQSVCFVLENALAEDQWSTAPRSMSTPNACTSGRSSSLVPPKTENLPESQALRAERETMNME